MPSIGNRNGRPARGTARARRAAAPQDQDGRADEDEREQRADAGHLADDVDLRERREDRDDRSTVMIVVMCGVPKRRVDLADAAGTSPSRLIEKKMRGWLSSMTRRHDVKPATAPAETSPAAQSWPITLNAKPTGALRNVSRLGGMMRSEACRSTGSA